jgi:pimeloyl-ACP methyl ester carboxylesterase
MFRPLGVSILVALFPFGASSLPARAAQQTPPMSEACPSADTPVREARFVPVGGIEQWVTITGHRCANPVLLFLHGGPGNPLSPYADAIFGDWQADFTLVHWDQRGAGRTFGRDPQADSAPLTVQRMTDDGLALAEYLAKRLGHRKITLVAGSWGSILGVHMIKARPDLFHAYVGFAQIVGSAQNQSATYRRLVALAQDARDTSVLTELERMGPPPWRNPRNVGIVRRATRLYESRASDPAPVEWWVRAPGDNSPEMLADAEAGEDYSYLQFVGLDGNGMFAGVDLPALGRDYHVPVFVVQGAEDLVTMPEVTRYFVDRIVSPAKELVLVPQAGHDPNRPMVEAIRDLLIRRIGSLQTGAAPAAKPVPAPRQD